MRISTKLIVNTVVVAIFSVFISTLAIGWMVYFNANNFLENLAKDRFISLRDAKAEQIRDYYTIVSKQIVTFAHDYTIVKAMQEFSEAFNQYKVQAGKVYKTDVIKNYIDQFVTKYAELNDGYIIDSRKLLNLLDDRCFALQYNYSLQNPYDLNNKSRYNYVPDSSRYSYVHKKLHPMIRQYQEKFKYHDILLADAKTGNIIYSVQKKLDYTTSLINGPYAKTAIGEAFRLANTAISKDFFAITDFSAYVPSYSNMAAFVASPIFAEEGNKIGILIFHISPDVINNIMTNNGNWQQAGWGDTGEAYILGSDAIMRTASRFFVEVPNEYLQQMHKLGVDEKTIRLMHAKQTTIGLQKINSIGAKEVTSGKTGISYYKDYRKQPVIATYEPLNIAGLDWGIICGIDTEEAFAYVHTLARKVIMYSIIIIIFISMVAIYIGTELSRQISVPIEKFNDLIYWFAKKQDLTKRIKVNTDDELGQMATALNTLVDNLQQACKDTVTSTKQVQQIATKLLDANNNINQEMVKNFTGDIEDFMQNRVKATEETEDSLQVLSSRLDVLSRQFKIFEEESERTSSW